MSQEKNIRAMHPVKLTSVANEIEADLIINLLKIYHIPCLQKSIGTGGYMRVTMGFSIYGIDLYVDESDYEKALHYLCALTPKEKLEEDNGTDDFFQKKYSGRKISVIILSIIFILLSLFPILSIAYQILLR